MTCIPADPTLGSMGDIVHQEKIDYVQDIAEAELPQIRAMEHLEQLVQLEAMFQEMIKMNVDEEYRSKLQNEQTKLKREIARATLHVGNAAIASQRAVYQIRATRGRTIENLSVHVSPIDWTASRFQTRPCNPDSILFNVQYFPNEDNNDTKAVLSFLTQQKYRKTMIQSTRETIKSQNQHHNLEGTILIAATCTHQQAQLVDPFALDPIKALTSWNSMFPDHSIDTGAQDIFRVAMSRDTTDGRRLRVISGANVTSSFIGMIHIYKNDNTNTTQQQQSRLLSGCMKDLLKSFLAQSEDEEHCNDGGEEIAKQVETLVNSSDLQHHCSMVAEGYRPDDDSYTADAIRHQSEGGAIMEQLKKIQASADENHVTNDNSGVPNTKQSTGWNHHDVHYKCTHHQTMGIKSLLTNFMDYVQKATRGNCGTPVNFYLRNCSATDIAKAYIRKYYPHGATTQRAAIAGQTGQLLPPEE